MRDSKSAKIYILHTFIPSSKKMCRKCQEAFLHTRFSLCWLSVGLFVDSGSKTENGSLETRIRFYLEGVFLPGIGVIGILGKLCLVSYLYMPFGSICIIAGNILSLHILRTANLELKPGVPLSMTLLG